MRKFNKRNKPAKVSEALVKEDVVKEIPEMEVVEMKDQPDEVNPQELIKDLTEKAEKAQQTAEVAVTGLNNVIRKVVPKEVLAKETFLNKVRLYLDGKGVWVKTAVGILVMLIAAFTGVGAEQMINTITGASDILVGLLSGGVIGLGGLASIFGTPKKFEVTDVESINMDGTIKLK